jgi:hypothetical protein
MQADFEIERQQFREEIRRWEERFENKEKELAQEKERHHTVCLGLVEALNTMRAQGLNDTI